MGKTTLSELAIISAPRLLAGQFESYVDSHASTTNGTRHELFGIPVCGAMWRRYPVDDPVATAPGSDKISNDREPEDGYRNGHTSESVNRCGRNWTTIKPGDRVSGLTITLAEGAASIHGQIKSAENQKLLARLFVYLVPAEREKAEDVLRFFASLVSTDGSFALNNLPSGSYWAIARPAGENVQSKRSLPDQAENRAKLRQEVEAAKTAIELKPCQNLTNYSLPIMVPYPCVRGNPRRCWL